MLTLLRGISLTLFRGVSSTYDSDFYSLSCFHSLRTKNKLESPKRYYNKNFFLKKMFCEIFMPSIDNKVINFNQYYNCEKKPAIIFGDSESCLKK